MDFTACRRRGGGWILSLREKGWDPDTLNKEVWGLDC